MRGKAKVILSLILLSMFLIIFCTVGSVYIYGTIPYKERAALIALYNNTHGDNWTNNSGWKTPPLHSDGFALPGTENKWYGISCDYNNTNVLRIRMENNRLIGPIPPELENLTELTKLWLTANQLTGDIPAELGNLSNLEKFFLSSNRLTGIIPPKLDNLSNLQKLQLNNNQLTGPIPPTLGNLTKLISFEVNNNQLTGDIPPELGNLTNLQTLHLYSNQLTGLIPPGLGNLTGLISLDLSGNQLTGPIPPELGNLSKLELLNLASNQLGGSIPFKLGNLSNLHKLYLNLNQLTGAILSEFGNLTSLTELNLDTNQLTGPIPPELGNLSKLELLDLASNQLGGSIPFELGNLSNLHKLYLNLNQLTDSIPPELGQLSKLQYLYLSSNQLLGKVPHNIVNLVSLFPASSDFRWNGLYTDTELLRDFLNTVQKGGDWESTQTIAPEQVTAQAISTTAIEVSWKPITYSSDEGGYRIFYSMTPGGPYTLFNSTASKYDFRLEITGLKPLRTYYFVVQTRTEPHEKNQNTVDSEYSAEVSEMAQEPYKTISGQLSTEKGKGIAGVTLFFSPSDKFAVTDSNGNYNHIVDLYWSGTVTPAKTGYTFEPEKISFENLTSDQPGTNFTGRSIPLSLSGKVTKGNEDIEGVTLTFAGDNGETETEVTDINGSYSHGVPYGWTGKAIPSKSDLLFYPPFIEYSLPGVTGNRDRQDFRLSIAFVLNAVRKQDNTLIFRKEYGEIGLNIGLEENAITAVQKFIIYRKEANGAFQPNKEFTATNQTDSYQFTYRDEYLDKGKTYTYIARAIGAQGKIIGESQERTI